MHYSACRPVILTGITNVIHRADLPHRTMTVELTRPEHRAEESELNCAFEEARASILGVLFPAVGTALRRWDDVRLPDLPRLADFAQWIEAAAPALWWEPGEFSALLAETQAEAALEAVAEDPFAQALLTLLEGRDGGDWTGYAEDLRGALNPPVDAETTRGRGWPRKAASVMYRLTRMGRELERLGVTVTRGYRTNRGMPLTLTLALRATDTER